MSESKLHDKWRNDKANFFMQPLNKDTSTAINDAEARATVRSHGFILENQKMLETEFLNLFAVLQKQKDENEKKNRAFWMYCYYCATLLEMFHKAYSQYSKEKEYQEFKQKIKNHLLKIKEEKKRIDEEAFIESFLKSITKSFADFFEGFKHISKIRNYVAYANLCRVYWVFCRLTMVSSFSLAKELDLLDKLEFSIFGHNTDVNKVIEKLNSPNGVLIYFSVGLFLMRFLIDAGMLVKHTFFPTDEEKKNKITGEDTTAYERFKFELYKRHPNFANDLVWATVNFITNFNHITHIPDPTAGIITAVFLGFDVLLTLYKCHLAKQEYLLKKAQYDKEIEDIRVVAILQQRGLSEQEQHSIEILEEQIKELEIGWRVKEETFYFNAAAAAILMMGFTGALLFSGPGAAVLCFCMCTLAVAMYLSSDSYTKLQEKSLRLENATDEEYAVAQREYDAALNDFIFTMIKNTVMPTLLIATWAACWPAAIVLTTLYICYEIYHAYDQHQSKKEDEGLALEAPKEDDFLDDEYDETKGLLGRDITDDICCSY
ncbi:TPA: hypothetical protein ACTXXA_003126 [Legionella anisa]